MRVQIKPRAPGKETDALSEYPNVSRVWYLPGRIALSFTCEHGIDRVYPLEHYEVQIVDDEPKR